MDSINSNLFANICFLCQKNLTKNESKYFESTYTQTTNRSLKSVLEHLVDLINIELYMPYGCAICVKCCDLLENYDELQTKLIELIQTAATYFNATPNEDIIVEEILLKTTEADEADAATEFEAVTIFDTEIGDDGKEQADAAAEFEAVTVFEAEIGDDGKELENYVAINDGILDERLTFEVANIITTDDDNDDDDDDDDCDEKIDKVNDVEKVVEVINEEVVDKINDDFDVDVQLDANADIDDEADYNFDDDYDFDNNYYFDDDYETDSVDDSITQLPVSNMKKTRSVSNLHVCDQCEMQFENKRFLTKHIMEIHKKQHKCDLCDFRHKSRYHVMLHKNFHENRSMNQCPFCDKTFKRKEVIIQHIEGHFNPKKYQCEKCGLYLPDSGQYQAHKLYKHSEKCMCTICHQVFKTKLYLKRHMILHAKDRPRYRCEFCGKSFSVSRTLKAHLEKHEEYIEQQTEDEKQ